jgi:hypothetical protein
MASGALGGLMPLLDPGVAEGITILTFYRDPTSPELERDADGLEYLTFMKTYAPHENPRDTSAVLG